MAKFTFKGGIHPPDNKDKTNKIPIKVLPAPKTLMFPMAQHIGAPAKPIVKKGDRVLTCQKIGEAQGFVSANIFSSISGTVTDVGLYPAIDGTKVMTVVIENDFLDERAEVELPSKDKSLADVAFDAGLVGMGGAAFPSHVKFSIPEGKSADIIILNGSECEPYITSDHRVMVEEGEVVVDGLKIVMEKLSAKEGYISIEKNKRDAIENMRKICEKYDNIHVVPLETKYPQGSEKHLIKSTIRKEVPSGKLPIDIGVVVLNIETAAEISHIYSTGAPLISRVVTVSGTIVNNPANFEVRIGTPITALIEAAGGLSEEAAKVISGGPMMGSALFSVDFPVVKGCGAILFFGEKDVMKEKCIPCIRCGRCVDACPMHLVPINLCNMAIVRDWEGCSENNVFDCIECGCCSFVCPSKRQIVQSIKLAKLMLREKKK